MSPPANPRARVGHDFGGRFATSGLEISIRAPAWGATSEAQRRALPERVSIRAPAWGATCIVWMASTMLSFQSTRPRGARPSPRNVRPCPLLFQSTRPRGARRGAVVDVLAVVDVSIHAPAWGATHLAIGRLDRQCVSIHVPAWGATFQERRPIPPLSVSIHAPTWGATRPTR